LFKAVNQLQTPNLLCPLVNSFMVHSWWPSCSWINRLWTKDFRRWTNQSVNRPRRPTPNWEM